jgi:hypothetical protein
LTEYREDSRNLRKEFGAETWTLILVPDFSFGEVKFRGAADLDIEVQGSNRSSRFFTSDQEL